MKTAGKRMVMMVLVLALVCGSVGLAVPKYASAKAVSKVTKVVTLTRKKDIIHNLSIKDNEEVITKVKILSVKGKIKANAEYLYFGDLVVDNGKGTMFVYPDTGYKNKLKKNSFKKGNVLTVKDENYFLSGKMGVWWSVLELYGIKSMKVKITYYTKSGRAGIKSLKQKIKTV